MKFTYKHTLMSCYAGYIMQAVVNNLAPLLFTAFCRDFDITVGQISLLITMNFATQLTVDALAVKLLRRIGMRRAAVMAHVFGAAGLILLGILPFVIEPFAGLCAAMIIMAIGGGITEVIISPMVEALPGDAKASAMSLLHSFYCWGQMGVVLLSTLYFTVIGSENWRFLPMIWAVLPAVNAVMFTKVPVCSLDDDSEPMRIRDMLRMKIFPVLLLMMVCAGASELAMSQWSSYFAESGLGVTKTAGDLLGPCGFAVLMGLARLIYGIKGEKIPLEGAIGFSCLLCIVSYMTAVFAPVPVISLIGCAICGLSVGLLWPGTFSVASRECPRGGNAMFALLALAGDLGCSSGPLLVGAVSESTGFFTDGILAAAVFPLLMIAAMLALLKLRKTHSST